MSYEFKPGDHVIVHGEIFTVLSKRMGLDFYEIGKVHRCNGQQFLTCVRNGLYASDMKLVTEATIENAQDIQREMEESRESEEE